MKNDKNTIIEKALQCNFKGTPSPEIPKQWRSELKQKIHEFDSREEMLLLKYEKSFCHIAWISFAASIFIFISLMYLLNKENLSSKDTIDKQIHEYLNIGNEFYYENKKTF